MLSILRQKAETIGEQLADIERQGGGMARFAHVCAGLLLVAGSLGSLISISAVAFGHFLAAASVGRLDVPDGINAVVGVLIVLAGDAALLYAASMLRVLRAAQAPDGEATVHLWVMWGVSLVEASTYLYMAWLFDPPTNGVLWLIDGARAIAWPLLCAYLSMARPLPVGPRDIMYHSALASGKGVVRDIATLSADPDAPLHHKVAIFRAASNMTAPDRTKLDALVTVLATPTPALASPEDKPEPEPPVPPRGRPISEPTEPERDTQAGQTPYVAALYSMPSPNRTVRRARGTVPQETTRLDDLRIQAFGLLNANPGLTRVKLRAKLKCNRAIASDLYTEWQMGRRRLSIVNGE